MSKKTCSKCGGTGPFGKNRSARDGLQRWCKVCLKGWASTHYKKNKKKILKRTRAYQKAHPEKYGKYDRARRIANLARYMWTKTKERARRRGIPFDLEVDDIVVPTHCPLLHLELACGIGRVQPNSPTLDRKVPALGYVKGNVWVISHRANAMKNDATLEELELLVRNLRASQA